jgi:hypothetical protein
MIGFASLFLGLLIGVNPVTVLVGSEVAAVAYELDGKPVGRLEGKPWTLAVDFGSELEPHELVARAYDRRGQEIGLARQWLNLPRALAEVDFVLEKDAEGKPRAARLVYASVLGPEPTRVSVTFDGRPLGLDEQRRMTLPLYDPFTTHILSAELEFPLNLRSRVDMALGGGSEGEAKSELTAVPVLYQGGDLPAPEKLQGWFSARGQEVRVVAVERGPAEVVLVRHPAPDDAITRLGYGQLIPRSRSPSAGYGVELHRHEMRLEKGDRVKIVWPFARSVRATNAIAELFDMTRDYVYKDGGFHWLLTRLYQSLADGVPLRFGDAVAVAGLQAYSGCTRRAVVLVLGKSAIDLSRYGPASVAHYLDKIHVPLYVWSLDEGSREASRWGTVEDVSTVGKLRKAVSRLKKDLEAQQIVWLAGRHLPQEIAVTEKAQGMSLLR